jgi:hypothetical protein
MSLNRIKTSDARRFDHRAVTYAAPAICGVVGILAGASATIGFMGAGALVAGAAGWLLVGGALAMFTGILFPLSRSALMVTSGMLVLAAIYLLATRQDARSGDIFLVIAFMVVLAGATAYLFSKYDFSRFWSTGYFEKATLQGRRDSMNTALVAWRDYPLFGAAPDAPESAP